MRADNRTQKSVKKKKRKKKRYLLKLAIIIAACIALHFILHIDYFTIAGITVAGNKAIPDEEIKKLSEIEVGDNIFDAHPFFAQKRIKENLYIEDVDVKRMLPNRIEIVVDERSGKAQMTKGKEFVIIDEEGRVLEIAKEEQKVTVIADVEVQKAKPDKEVEVKDKDEEVYNKALALINAAETGDLYFKKIVIQGNAVEAYIYDTLICKGKYTDVMKCIESGALKATVFDLYQKDREKGVINIGSNNYCSFTPKK